MAGWNSSITNELQLISSFSTFSDSLPEFQWSLMATEGVNEDDDFMHSFGTIINGMNDVSYVTCEGLKSGELNSEQPNTAIGVYPNPSRGEVTITLDKLPAKKISGTISILNITGELLYESATVFQIDSPIQLDLGHLPNGIYLIRIEGSMIQRAFKIEIQR